MTDKIRIGIIGGAEIAHRRFMPALLQLPEYICAGVASHDKRRRSLFQADFGVNTFANYEDIIEDSDINAVYIPLPPALHYEWAKKALVSGKHILLEKPATIHRKDTDELISIANSKGVALFENYMFQYHSQLNAISTMVKSGVIGDIRLYRTDFSFPLRSENDFRYDKKLGGGSLFDAGGYVVKLASLLLGDICRVTAASLSGMAKFGVDLYGSVSFINNDGLSLQGQFGIDNFYRCSLEVYGSSGAITTDRIFTAPPNHVPVVNILRSNGDKEIIELEPDDSFKNSLVNFALAVREKSAREEIYRRIGTQSSLVEDVLMVAKNY